MLKCVRCGGDVSRHHQVCSYCGTHNPDYYPPERKVNLLLEKGLEAFENSHFAEAVDYFVKIFEVDPDVFEAFIYLAGGYPRLRYTEEATKTTEKAQKIRPGSALINSYRGILYKQMGRKAEVRANLEKAVELVKTDATVDDYRKEFKKTIEKALAEYKRWKLFQEMENNTVI
ncbi:MAG TPA: hypothetical protein VIO61_06470 [Anaerolineaceae bacterium]